MKTEIKEKTIQKIMNEIGKDFVAMLINGLEENPELFPYTTACINFIIELHEKEIILDFNAFNPEIINAIYEELTSYIHF